MIKIYFEEPFYEDIFCDEYDDSFLAKDKFNKLIEEYKQNFKYVRVEIWKCIECLVHGEQTDWNKEEMHFPIGKR